MSDKESLALKICEEVMTGLTNKSLTTVSSFLLCLRIAHLVDDRESQEWLNYELNGYPETESGQGMTEHAQKIALDHGRGLLGRVFTELALELENDNKRGSEKPLSILKIQCFKYALKWQMALQFGDKAE